MRKNLDAQQQRGIGVQPFSDAKELVPPLPVSLIEYHRRSDSSQILQRRHQSNPLLPQVPNSYRSHKGSDMGSVFVANLTPQRERDVLNQFSSLTARDPRKHIESSVRGSPVINHSISSKSNNQYSHFYSTASGPSKFHKPVAQKQHSSPINNYFASQKNLRLSQNNSRGFIKVFQND